MLLTDPRTNFPDWANRRTAPPRTQSFPSVESERHRSRGAQSRGAQNGGDGEMNVEPVHRLRVRGTEDLELVYEVVQPGGMKQ
jgi:hypothetical protein